MLGSVDDHIAGTERECAIRNNITTYLHLSAPYMAHKSTSWAADGVHGIMPALQVAALAAITGLLQHDMHACLQHGLRWCKWWWCTIGTEACDARWWCYYNGCVLSARGVTLQWALAVLHHARFPGPTCAHEWGLAPLTVLFNHMRTGYCTQIALRPRC